MWFRNPPPTSDIVRQVHDSPAMAVIVVTGAGSRALGWLFAEPGASRTVLDARIPYSVAALDEYVGSRADQHVSAEEARLIAERSYWRALQLLARGRPGRIGETPAIGLGCTATIATDRPKKGDHRCHVAVRTAEEAAMYSLSLRKGARDRGGEEEIVSRMVLNALSAGCGVEERMGVATKGDEQVTTTRDAVSDPLTRLTSGELSVVTMAADGSQTEGAERGRVLVAGSFNPLHDGHLRLAEVASRLTGRPAGFEISISNVDKPDIPLRVLHARLAQFLGRHPVVVTRAATFVDKAALLPDTKFVVGYDTASRLFDQRFYPAYNPVSDRDRAGSAVGIALGSLLRTGATFLVAGRAIDGVFRTLGDIKVPPLYRGMLQAIPESEFRSDLSSTAIRESVAVHR